jgi:hypothetical protein
MDILNTIVAQNYIKLRYNEKEDSWAIRYTNLLKIFIADPNAHYPKVIKYIKYLSFDLFKGNTEIDLPDNLLYFKDNTRICVRYHKEYNEYPFYLMYICTLRYITSFNKYLILIAVHNQPYIDKLPPYLKYLKCKWGKVVEHFRYNDELLYLICGACITSWYPQYLISMHTQYANWGPKHIDNPHLYYICYMDTLTKYKEYLDRTPINRIGYWVIMDMSDVRPYSY